MSALVKYDEARRALAEAHSIDEIASIRDRAEAARQYARVAGDIEMVNWAAEIRIRAERRAGEILREMAEQGARDSGDGGNRKSQSRDATVKLTDLGIDKHESSRWQKVAAVPEPEFERYVAETKSERRELTSAGVRKLAKQEAARQHAYNVDRQFCTVNDLEALASAVEGEDKPGFGTVYADPPWRYNNQGTRGATGDHYVGMSIEEICALPVTRFAAANSHLHLWTTSPFLFEAQRVIEAWGFTYKSSYVWVKPQMGMGNYWRVSHEFLLLGVRGELTSFPERNLMSWGQFNRSQHSAKPERIRDLIHKVSPGPRIELFARRVTPGWWCWGNEIGRDIFAAGADAA